MSHKWENPF